MKYLSRLSKEIISKNPSCVYIFRNKFKDEQVVKMVDTYALVRYTDIKGVEYFRTISPATVEFIVALVWYKNLKLLKRVVELFNCDINGEHYPIGWRTENRSFNTRALIDCKDKEKTFPGVMEFLTLEEDITEEMIMAEFYFAIEFDTPVEWKTNFDFLFYQIYMEDMNIRNGFCIGLEDIDVRKFLRTEYKKMYGKPYSNTRGIEIVLAR